MSHHNTDIKTDKVHPASNGHGSVVIARCGPVYRDCNVCDDERKYHPQGDCGFHYNAAGWDMLGTAVASAIQAVL